MKLLVEQRKEFIAIMALSNFIDHYEARYFSFLTVHAHKGNSI